MGSQSCRTPMESPLQSDNATNPQGHQQPNNHWQIIMHVIPFPVSGYKSDIHQKSDISYLKPFKFEVL
jgi:hypothetical protein